MRSWNGSRNFSCRKCDEIARIARTTCTQIKTEKRNMSGSGNGRAERSDSSNLEPAGGGSRKASPEVSSRHRTHVATPKYGQARTVMKREVFCEVAARMTATDSCVSRQYR